MFGFYRIAAGVPRLNVADVDYNVEQILKLAEAGQAEEAAVMIFPELAVTGYSCADLFHNRMLLTAAEHGVRRLLRELPDGPLFAIGAPVEFRNRLFNAALVIRNHRLLGIVPKSNLPNYREFYEKRYFSSGWNLRGETLAYAGEDRIPIGVDLLFETPDGVRIGVEICEDLWSVIPPSSRLALAGATLLLNLSASDELVGKADYRRGLVARQSASCVAVYAYVSCGVHESTTDVVCGGHALIAENGSVILDSDRFGRESVLYTGDVDLERVAAARLSDSPFSSGVEMSENQTWRRLVTETLCGASTLRRRISPQPFVPEQASVRDERCREIFAIQSAGLAKRIEHTRAQSLVIGISGGLDSTLALLVCVNTMKLLGRCPGEVIAITMPGFGTTDRTYSNAVGLCRKLGVTLREISIKDACLRHFEAIGHDPGNHNVVYENSQARERTQILLDVANQTGGIAVGTGDLSELAMGWCTYNGDHISMYSVNCSVPKTLIRYVIGWVGDNSDAEVKAILDDVIATPVSPELLPAQEDGTISQKTEDIIGPYEVHDFFLYHFHKYGAAPEKLLYLAVAAFGDVYSESALRNFLKTFLRRFFSQQFKRSCMPDGPKVGTISLSPRGDWRMPSDAAVRQWLESLEK